MGRTANLSPMGLFNWDNTIFDLMQVPTQLDRNALINNILAETAELEVLYPNPTVFKNLLGVWSSTQIDIWNRLYATTQYEYNPIENYNRYETGSDSGSGSTRHTGTDTTAETTAQGGMDTHSDALTNGGRDQRTGTNALSGTDSTTRENELGGTDQTSRENELGGTDQTASSNVMSGTDRTSRENELGGSDSFEKNTTHSGEDVDTGVKDSGHWIAGFNSVASGTDDGLVKQTRDSETSENRHDYGEVVDETGETTYGKTESETGSITYGKTENGTGSTTYGKTESETGSTTYGKTESETGTTTYGKTETENETINFGKTENRTGNIAYGKTETKNGSMTHGETITTENDGEHELHAHGNIGVTTTQKLIREQREVDKFNLYDIITDEFKMRFCILVY